MIHITRDLEVADAEIGDDYLVSSDGVEVKGISRLDSLTDDSDGQEILTARLKGVRRKRRDLLFACDWTQMQDVTLPEELVLSWRQYRQALRDLPESVTLETMYSVIWPEPPVQL